MAFLRSRPRWLSSLPEWLLDNPSQQTVGRRFPSDLNPHLEPGCVLSSPLTSLQSDQAGLYPISCDSIVPSSTCTPFALEFTQLLRHHRRTSAVAVRGAEAIRYILSINSASFRYILAAKNVSLPHSNCAVTNVLEATLQQICRSTRPVWAVGEAKRPKEFDSEASQKPRLVLALDSVRYPQNAALLISSAIGLGFDLLYFTSGTVDPFNWKVLEQTAGSHWDFPYKTGTTEHLLNFCEENRLLPCVTHTRGRDPQELKRALSRHSGFCCIVGNESEGPSEALLRKCTKVALPMSSLVESLNVAVAGGVIMHAMHKLIS